MSTPSAALALCLALLTPPAAHAEEALRLSAETAGGWTAMPGWLSDPDPDAAVGVTDGALDFRVPAAGRGMKWQLPLEPLDAAGYPWLVVRYRLVGTRPDAGDYLVYLQTDRGEAPGRLLGGTEAQADGAWHTCVLDLERRGLGTEVGAVAVQCQAGPGGDAHLLLEYLAFTDAPPAGAEGDAASTPEEMAVEPPINTPAQWAAQRSWLGNPADDAAVSATPEGVRFEVGTAARGMKWSTSLAEPVVGAVWLAARYRARGVQNVGNDYAVYVANAGGGAAPQEQNCLTFSDLDPDGEWHVAVGRVTVPEIRTIAVQVQATEAPGTLELASLRFTNARPGVPLGDVLPFSAGHAASQVAAFRPLEVPQPNAAGTDLARLLHFEGWLPAGEVTIRGVPFVCAPDAQAAQGVGLKGTGDVALTVPAEATEVYLLLAVRFSGTEEPSYGGGALRQIVDPHRFVTSVVYDDGTVDDVFPARLSGGRPLVSAGVDVYVVAPTPGKRVERLLVRDRMARGAFYVAAATANPGPQRLRPELVEEPAPYRVAPGPPLTGWGPPTWYEPDEGISLISAFIENRPDAPLGTELFRVQLGNRTIGSGAFVVTRHGTAGGEPTEAEWTGDGGERLVAQLWRADLAEPDQTGWTLRLKLRNSGPEPVTVTPLFPWLGGVRFGPAVTDTWTVFPQQGAVVSNQPLRLRAPYSGAFPFQFVGAFGPDQGMALYVMTHDLTVRHRFYNVEQREGAATLWVEYPELVLAPGEEWESPESVIGACPGDWHGPWEAYRRWLATWYRPAAPRKQWFREVFNFRQQFMHFPIPKPSGMYDEATAGYHFQEVVDQDAAAFGGVDYLHIFDWGWSEQFGRCGDYDHWAEQVGSAEAFRAAIQGVQDRGIPVGLYIEGYLIDPPSNVAKAHGEAWQLLDAEGKPYPYFAPSLDMCSAVPAWQEYLAGVYRRTREVTGAMGYYIDEMGFADMGHFCYAPNHGHPVPYPPVPGQLELTRRVREALGPEAALYTEESPVDVTSQYQDGSFTYNISRATDELSPTHLNLYRFTVPSFKTFEIITCDQPLGTNVAAVERVFFSGEGIWLEGTPNDWFSDEVRATIAKTHAILRAHRGAFTADDVWPLAPTLRGGVYANRFGPAAGGREVVWTLCNANPRTLRGEVIAVPHREGATYRDLWHDRPVEARVEGGQAYLSVEIGPRDVGCVAQEW